jgi:phosphoribosylaminoimidazolecarboxamide formyltransferase / IMP cyclohydrolase
MTQLLPIRRALISVSNKTGLEQLVAMLHSVNAELVSTGSTAALIRELGYQVTEVAEVTHVPEMLDGRVKTLHPNIHAGILADKTNPDHIVQLEKLGIAAFDLLVVNLYPFVETVSSNADFATIIENIDIGGPAMVRAAAKNFNSIAVLTDPAQYELAISAITAGGFDHDTRLMLAKVAFSHTATYDSAIASWLAKSDLSFIALTGSKKQDLRYGENPQQRAAVYQSGGNAGIANAVQLQGKELSFNNLVDADAAWRAVLEHETPTVAIVKHTNPCGIATANLVAEAYSRAHNCDPVSAFGSVIAANVEIDEDFAKRNAEIFTEVIVAPSYTSAALELFAARKNLRLLQVVAAREELEIKPISGGFLVQQVDGYENVGDQVENWELVAGEKATESQLQDLSFAWRSVRSVKSNAIVLVKDQATVGIGMGQVNRVDSVRLAVNRAANRAGGSVAASDAFFPFADGVTELIAAGVSAIVQPGGSVRDAEVIAAAQAAGITMYLTGTRHFWH